ncbi:MAG TPA: hypothetical protein VNB94_01940 [Mycobacteriales bacterium]|nr:hypothetical protein [Mycobacteriales bacterium]
MYHATTGTIVAGAAATPVVGNLAAQSNAEVLGVKISQGANPFVATVQGVADGTLPLTGINLLFVLLTAITLMLMGVTMVRIGRNLTTATA